MLGTIINTAAVILGAVIGIFCGNSFSEKLQNSLMAGMGIFVVFSGADLFLESENSIIPLMGLVIGTVIGELLRIEERVESLGGFIQNVFQRLTAGKASASREQFIKGFVSMTLIICIGPMAILGSIQDGMGTGCQTLLVKSLLDGIMAIAFGSSLGIGVAFSALPVLVYQGGISLLAGVLNQILSTQMITEMSACGGIMLAAVGINSLLQLKKIRVSNMIPGLIITPLLCFLLSLF